MKVRFCGRCSCCCSAGGGIPPPCLPFCLLCACKLSSCIFCVSCANRSDLRGPSCRSPSSPGNPSCASKASNALLAAAEKRLAVMPFFKSSRKASTASLSPSFLFLLFAWKASSAAVIASSSSRVGVARPSRKPSKSASLPSSLSCSFLLTHPTCCSGLSGSSITLRRPVLPASRVGVPSCSFGSSMSSTRCSCCRCYCSCCSCRPAACAPAPAIAVAAAAAAACVPAHAAAGVGQY
mmetsp:Transcript_17649/g.46229  ORF Transcript_17649/g.46229 Transcript_17649/m.46229 type:complete len:237 (+) Transcript_17649:278-988(+)